MTKHDRTLSTFTLTLALIFAFLTGCLQSANASLPPLTVAKINVGFPSAYGVAFSHNGEEAYFGGGNGSVGLRMIPQSSMTDGAIVDTTTADAFNAQREELINSSGGFQIHQMVSSLVPGKNGHYWTYAASGNSKVNEKSVIWAFDQTTRLVEIIELTTREGYSPDTLSYLTITPNGKYIYAVNGTGIYKINALTNSQIGLPVIETEWAPLAATNDFLYYVAPTGIKSIKIDGDSNSSTGDGSAVLHTVTGSASSVNFWDIWVAWHIYDGHIYVATYGNNTVPGKMAVVNLSDFSGDAWTISETSKSGWTDGFLGADNYFYLTNWDEATIVKIDLSTKEIVAASPTLTGASWYNGAASADRTKMLFASDSEDNAMYLVNINPANSTTNPYASNNADNQETVSVVVETAEERANKSKTEVQAKIDNARNSILSSISQKPELSPATLKEAALPIISKNSLELVNLELKELVSKSEEIKFSAIETVVKKYESYEKIVDGSKSLMPDELQKYGVIPTNIKNPTLVTLALLNASPNDRSDIATIQKTVQAAIKKLEERAKKIAALQKRTSSFNLQK